MNEMEKYLEALAAAVESNNKKAVELLEGFSAYVYQELHARASSATGEDHAVWDSMYKRAQALIIRMANLGPSMWD